jgi:probable rRNA maturation factor
MNLAVDIQVASDSDDPPEPDSINRWLRAALERELPADDDREIEISVRLVDREESQTLNRHYRQKDKPTNVLSFPSDLPPDLPFRHLGDIVICAPVIRDEAREQGKPVDDHWAHMLVHGALHLLGYDHIEDSEAAEMEEREVAILAQLGIADPYQTL